MLLYMRFSIDGNPKRLTAVGKRLCSQREVTGVEFGHPQYVDL